MYTSHVGAILVITQLLRAKTSFALIEKKSYAGENRYKHDLTLRLGSMLVIGITLVATLVKIL